jgi:hypothetical protein
MWFRGRRRARDLAKHTYENQIRPQMLARDMEGIDVAMAYTGDETKAGWVSVTCIKCERTAQVPAEAVKPGQVALCPRCM